MLTVEISLKKGLDLEHLITIHEPDVISLTETWLHESVFDNEFVTPAFGVYRRACNSKVGGGALHFKINFKVTRMKDAAGVEALFCKLFYDSHCFIIRVMYRPPGAEQMVLESLKHHITSVTSRTSKVILCGDFNFLTINWPTFTAANKNTINNEELIVIAFRFDLTQLGKDYGHVALYRGRCERTTFPVKSACHAR